jgi:hypothetical protein
LIASISLVSVSRTPNRIWSIRAMWSLGRISRASWRPAMTSARSATSGPHCRASRDRPVTSTSTTVLARL